MPGTSISLPLDVLIDLDQIAYIERTNRSSAILEALKPYIATKKKEHKLEKAD